MKENKPKQRKAALDRFKYWWEHDGHDDHYISPTAGKRQPWYLRVIHAVFGFVLDVITAIKAIIKEVM